MSTSIFLARLIGPVALVVAISVLLNAASFRAMAKEFLRSPALIYLSGLLSMTAGLAILLSHNVWTANWPTLLTVFGWLATIGGAVRIAFPDRVKAIGEKMLNKPLAMKVAAGIWSVVGLLLCFFGYLH